MRAICLLFALVGCTSGDLDSGRRVACKECGPGAVTEGRFVSRRFSPDAIAANGAGQFVRAADGVLAWLDDSLAPSRTVPLDAAYGELEPRRVALAEDGEVLLLAHNWDDFNPNPELLELDADGRERWRFQLGSREEPSQIAIGGSLVFLGPAVGNGRYKVPGHVLTDNFIIALDRETGALAWEVQLPAGPPTAFGMHGIHLAAMPDGGVAISGSFIDTLALGGTAQALANRTGATSTGYLATLDAAGHGRWAIALDPGNPGTFASEGALEEIAVGPRGEVAVAGTWTGAIATFGGVALAPMIEANKPVGQMLALVAPGGAVTWAHPFGRRYQELGSLVTDGSEVIASGSHDAAVFLDPELAEPEGTDGYIVAADTAQRWFRPVRGHGTQGVQLHALTADRILASVYAYTSEDDTQAPTIVIGDVAVSGSGFLIAELAR